MIIFGWGSGNKMQQISPAQALILRFSYIHIFWLFRVSFGFKYALATQTAEGWATRALTPAEATSYDATTRLTLNWWWRYGLLITIGTIVVLGMLASLG